MGCNAAWFHSTMEPAHPTCVTCAVPPVARAGTHSRRVSDWYRRRRRRRREEEEEEEEWTTPGVIN
jgi:hypothetical protein